MSFKLNAKLAERKKRLLNVYKQNIDESSDAEECPASESKIY